MSRSNSSCHGASPSASGNRYNIRSLDDLPLMSSRHHHRHRQHHCLPPRVLAVCIGLCGVFAIGMSIVLGYLFIRLRVTQAQLTSVQLEMTKVQKRMDAFELLSKQLKMKYRQRNHVALEPDTDSNQLTEVGERTKQRRSVRERAEEKRRRIWKRQANVTKSRSKDIKSNAKDDGWTIVGDVKEESESRNKGKNSNEIKQELDKLKKYVRNLEELCQHPASLMVLPYNSTVPEIAYKNIIRTEENAIQWSVKHNALFVLEETPEKPSSFVVRSPGHYFVYVQVTYNGQEKRNTPTCSHVLMRENKRYPLRNGELLYGSTTQYKLGNILHVSASGGAIRAIDTVYQSGVFHLIEGDRLSIRPDVLSSQCIVSTFKEKTFFGALRLQFSYHDFS